MISFRNVANYGTKLTIFVKTPKEKSFFNKKKGAKVLNYLKWRQSQSSKVVDKTKNLFCKEM